MPSWTTATEERPCEAVGRRDRVVAAGDPVTRRGGGLGVSGRAEEEEEGGKRKKRGALLVAAGGRRSLHSEPDVTGPGLPPLSFKEGRRTSNLPRFSAFNPSRTERPKEECQFAESPPRDGGGWWWLQLGASEWKF